MNVTRQSFKGEPPIRVGETVDGKYFVEDLLHEDEHAVLVGARHNALGFEVAIKVLRAEAANHLQAFIDQTRLAWKMKSPHMTKLHVMGQLRNGCAYAVMERLHGYHLGRLVAAHVPMIDRDVYQYVADACEPLAEAHASGQAHGNLRPACLFLALRADGPPIIKLTGLIDTLRPPHASPAADIHALGMLLEALRTGYAPGSSLASILSRCRSGGYREVTQLRDDLRSLLTTISA